MKTIEVVTKELSHVPIFRNFPYKKTREETQVDSLLLDGSGTMRIFPELGFFRFSERDEGIQIDFIEAVQVEGLIRVFKGVQEVKSDPGRPFNKSFFQLALYRSRSNFSTALYVNTSTRKAVEFRF